MGTPFAELDLAEVFDASRAEVVDLPDLLTGATSSDTVYLASTPAVSDDLAAHRSETP
jgi:hypothetical protein